jgi:hypothetical protein
MWATLIVMFCALWFAGSSAIAKYLGHIDSTYSSLFLDSQWSNMFEKQDSMKLGKLAFDISQACTKTRGADNHSLTRQMREEFRLGE